MAPIIKVTNFVVLLAACSLLPATVHAQSNAITTPIHAQEKENGKILLAAATGNGGVKPGSVLVITESGTHSYTSAQWAAIPAKALQPAFCMVR
jgi:hypothetical protein